MNFGMLYQIRVRPSPSRSSPVRYSPVSSRLDGIRSNSHIRKTQEIFILLYSFYLLSEFPHQHSVRGFFLPVHATWSIHRSRTGYWGEFLDLRGCKCQDPGENYTVSSFMIHNVKNIYIYIYILTEAKFKQFNPYSANVENMLSS